MANSMANSMAKGSVQMSDTDKFMEKFDPSQSNREKRKKLQTQPSDNNGGGKKVEKKASGIMYNDKGILLHDGADVCDCLSDRCPGCFFPCPKCRSPKCGLECRINRRWVNESIEIEGSNETIVKNNHLPPK